MFYRIIRTLMTPPRKIEEYVPIDANILDVGSGHGILASYLVNKSNRRKVLGIDPSKSKVEESKKLMVNSKNLRFRKAYLHEINGTKFDCITIVDVLYLLSKKEKIEMLRKAKSLLKKGGLIILKEIDTKPIWKRKVLELEEKFMINTLGYTYSDNKKTYLTSEGNYKKIFKQLRLRVKKIDKFTSIFFYLSHIIFVVERN